MEQVNQSRLDEKEVNENENEEVVEQVEEQEVAIEEAPANEENQINEPSEEQTQEPEQSSSSEQQSVEKSSRRNNFRYRKDIRSLKNEVKELKQVIEALKQPDPVKQLMEDFDVDEETASKLHKNFGQKSAENKGTSESDIIEDFRNEAAEYQQELIESGEDISPYASEAQKLLEKEYALSGVRAFDKGPEFYMEAAKKAYLESQQKKKTNIEKTSQKNLATTAKPGGSSKPKMAKKITPEWVKSLSPAEYKANHKAIMDAVRRGELTV